MSFNKISYEDYGCNLYLDLLLISYKSGASYPSNHARDVYLVHKGPNGATMRRDEYWFLVQLTMWTTWSKSHLQDEPEWHVDSCPREHSQYNIGVHIRQLGEMPSNRLITTTMRCLRNRRWLCAHPHESNRWEQGQWG